MAASCGSKPRSNHGRPDNRGRVGGVVREVQRVRADASGLLRAVEIEEADARHDQAHDDHNDQPSDDHDIPSTAPKCPLRTIGRTWADVETALDLTSSGCADQRVWRFPVKSMLGQRCDRPRCFTPDGVLVTVPGPSSIRPTARWPAPRTHGSGEVCLACRAEFVDEPESGEQSSVVRITLPTAGRSRAMTPTSNHVVGLRRAPRSRSRSGSPGADLRGDLARPSRHAPAESSPARAARVDEGDQSSDLRWARASARTFFDLAPVHLVTRRRSRNSRNGTETASPSSASVPTS